MHVVFLSGWGWPFVPVYIYTFLCASLYSLHNTYCFFPSFSIAASPFTISLSFLLACYTGTHVHVRRTGNRTIYMYVYIYMYVHVYSCLCFNIQAHAGMVLMYVHMYMYMYTGMKQMSWWDQTSQVYRCTVKMNPEQKLTW